MDKKELFERDHYAAYLGVKVVDISKGSAVLSMDVVEHHLNFLGAAHGGALFSLADMAFGLASNSEQTVRVGIEAQMSYIERVDAGERLLATAHKVSENRRTAVYRVDVTRNNDIIAAFTGTVYITNRSFDQNPA